MLSDFELTRIAKLIDPEAAGYFRQMLKNAAKAGAEEIVRKLLEDHELAERARICRDKYCEIIPGKKRWAELTDHEQRVDMVCLKAAILGEE